MLVSEEGHDVLILILLDGFEDEDVLCLCEDGKTVGVEILICASSRLRLGLDEVVDDVDAPSGTASAFLNGRLVPVWRNWRDSQCAQSVHGLTSCREFPFS